MVTTAVTPSLAPEPVKPDKQVVLRKLREVNTDRFLDKTTVAWAVAPAVGQVRQSGP
jgi:hypothetical protein